MRIGLDGKLLTLRAGGIGRYAIELTRALLAEASARRPELEFTILTAPQTSPAVLEALGGRCAAHYVPARSSVLRSLVFLPATLRRLRIDIFHGMDHVGIPLAGREGKCVVTVHDLIPLLLPRTFTRRHRTIVRLALARVRRRADLVLVPSRAVQRDVVERLGVEEERVVVVPHGCEARFRPARGAADAAALSAAAGRLGLPPRYVLAVGTLEPRKNLTTLLHAYARLRAAAAAPPPELVLAGARGWLDGPVRQTVRALGLEAVVRLPGFIDDDDLPAVYRGAELVVFPSLREGFGLPLLEAMASGVPVVASSAPALPEVAGGAALLVDPLDVEAMAAAAARALRDQPLREKLRAAGIARAAQFSWTAAARQTLDAYASLA